MARQFLRACSLIVADMSGNGIELAGERNDAVLRIRFTVNYQITQSPANLHARIYNLSQDTVAQLIALASKERPTISAIPHPTSARVILKAGYLENVSTVFTGQIYQMRVGKESNVDSYLDIFAADGDLAHNWATMNTTFAKGYTADDLWSAAGQSMSPWQVTTGDKPDGLSTPAAPRGCVTFGMTRDVLRDLSASNNFTWNILDSQLQGRPKFAFNSNEAVVIDSLRGMVGVPEQTEAGITVVTLLNPAIRWGTRVQLDNNEIAQLVFNKTLGSSNLGAVSPNPPWSSQSATVPPLNTDGQYVVIYATHIGDTRGNEWYTRLTCLSVDPTAIKPSAINIKLPPPLSPG